MTSSTFFLIRAFIYIVCFLVSFKFAGFPALIVTIFSLALLEIAYKGLAVLAEEHIKLRAVVLRDITLSPSEDALESGKVEDAVFGDVTLDEIHEFRDNPKSENAIDEFLDRAKESQEFISILPIEIKRNIIRAIADRVGANHKE